MLTFFKRERVLTMLPWCALFTAAMLLPFGPSYATSRSVLGRDVDLAYSFTAMLCLQAVLLLAGRHLPVRTRVREFERALPVTMRRVVLERLAAVWATLFGTFFAGSLVWLYHAAPDGDLSSYGRGLTRAFAASGASVFLLGCYRPTRPVLSTPEAILVSVASCAVWLSAALFIDLPTLVYVAALVVQIAFLWMVLSGSSPASDPKVVSSPASPRQGGSGDGLPVRLFGALNWTILRSTILRPQVVWILALLGASLWWGLAQPIMLGMFLVMVPFMAIRMGLNVLHGIDSLPIHRERVLRLASLGALVALSVLMVAASRSPQEFRGYEILSRSVEVDACFEEVWGGENEYRTHVKVPPELWRMTSEASDAVVTADWGESVQPTLHPIYPGAEVFTYNPYDVGPDSSVRFLAWQVTRAIEVVHGPAERVHDHFLDWIDTLDQREAISDARIGDMSTADWGLAAPKGFQARNAMGFAALLAVLVWLMATGYLLLPNTPSKSRPGWMEGLPNGAGGTAVAAVMVIVFVLMDINDASLMPALGAQLHAWIDARLGSSPALWAALVASLTATGYAFLAWRIQRIEIPPLAVHGWTKKPMAIY